MIDFNRSAHDISGRTVIPKDVQILNATSKIFMLGFLCLVLAAVVRLSITQPSFNISRIVIEGDVVHQNQVTLQANLAGRLTGNYFTLNLDQTRSALEAVPWVRKAVVKREFPDRLRARIQEHESAAWWGDASDTKMLNSYGEIFDAQAEGVAANENEPLPRLIGAENQAKSILDFYRQLNSALTAYDAALDRLELTHQNAWVLTLDEGTVIELGSGDNKKLLARLHSFLSTYQQASKSYQRQGWDRIERVDLRHMTGYALRLRGVTTLDVTPIDVNATRAVSELDPRKKGQR